MSLNLWQELLNPSAVIAADLPDSQQSDLAWDWLFEKSPDGAYIRVGLAHKIIWRRSYELHKQGWKDTGLMALYSTFKQFGPEPIDKVARTGFQRASRAI